MLVHQIGQRLQGFSAFPYEVTVLPVYDFNIDSCNAVLSVYLFECIPLDAVPSHVVFCLETQDSLDVVLRQFFDLLFVFDIRTNK